MGGRIGEDEEDTILYFDRASFSALSSFIFAIRCTSSLEFLAVVV